MRTVFTSFLTIFMLISICGSAQVGIGTTSPNGTAVLDISSTSKGLLIPRLTTTQRTAISSPAKGLIVFDNDSSYFFYYTGSAWRGLKNIDNAPNYWLRSGSSTTLSNNGDNVGIGTSSPGSTAALEISSTSKGLLIPRMTTTQRNAISSPGTGLMVYDNTLNSFYYYNGTAWTAVSGTSGSWTSSSGNTTLATSTDNVGIGKTPIQKLDVQGTVNTDSSYWVGGKKAIVYGAANHNILVGEGAGRLATGTNNIMEGYQSGYYNTSGFNNIFHGYQTGYSNTTGTENIFTGTVAGYSNTTGSNNIFSGYLAGYSNTSGDYNNFSGYKAGYSNTTGAYNNFSGYKAGISNTTGTNNIFSGYEAGVSNTSGNDNNFFGYQAGASNSSGDNNNFTGAYSGRQNTLGGYNSFYGHQSGQLNSTGSLNTFMGYGAGYNNTTGYGNASFGTYAGINYNGTHNSYFGDSADANTSGLTNATAIGYNAKVGQSNSIVLGNGSANVGIGTSTPAASSVLDLTSTTKGILIPRMTTTQRNAISSPATGLQVYDLTLNALYYYNGTVWTATTSSSSPFGKSGSDVTLNTSTDNVGIGKTPTTKLDVQGPINTDSSYWVGGKKAIVYGASSHNIMLGEGAGKLTTGTNNIMEGYQSGYKNTSGFNNIFHGYQSGYSNTTGSENVVNGTVAGYSNTTGSNNIFTGPLAGYSNTTGSDNIFNGYQSGYSNTTGSNNLFNGRGAGFYNTTGSNNIFSGYQSGLNNTTGDNNNLVGYMAGRANTTGSYNSFYGHQAGQLNSTGLQNTFMGYGAGYNNSTGYGNASFGSYAGINYNGTHNSYFGDSADASVSGLTNATAIGFNARVGQSNSIVLGNGSANVGVGTSTPAASAALDLTSITKGILIPRMTTTQRNAISSPATGLQVYDLTLNALYYYNGTTWTATTSSSSPFGKSGSDVTLNTATDNVGIGKTPATKLDVQGVVNTDSSYWVGGKKAIVYGTTSHNIMLGEGAGKLTTGTNNIMEGYQSGYKNTSGFNNIFHGYQSGYSNTTGTENIVTGTAAGYSNTTGANNIFTGYLAGYSNTTGNYNMFSGNQAGFSNTSGFNNIFMGYWAGYSNTTGNNNIFTGIEAGYSNTTGLYNNFTGYLTGRSNTSGSNNNFTGYLTGYYNTTGSYNSFYGHQAGQLNSTGLQNTFMGYGAGYNNTTGYGNTSIGNYAGINYNGSRNSYFGDSADASASGLTNATAIGYNARVGQSNSIVLGNGSANVGVGTSTPAASAALDLTSTTKGILIPRMTTTQRNAISSPATGLQVYDLTLNALYYYNGSAWTATTSSSSPFGKSGSDVTLNTSTDNVGIGKTPATKLDVQGIVNTDSSYWVGGKKAIVYGASSHNIMLGEGAGKLTTGTNNIMQGYQSGYKNTSGFNNIFHGYQTGYSNTTGTENIITGTAAGYSNTTGSNNIFSGYLAGYSNTSGDYNNFSGYQAGYSNTTGNYNNISGYRAGYSNTTGTNNIFSGFFAGFYNTTGNNNIFTGYQAGSFNTTGSNNIYLGYNTGLSNTTGSYNSFYGHQAGQLNSTGLQNTFMGYGAGYNNTTGYGNTSIGNYAGINYNGSRNSYFGDSADASVSGLTNATAIGYNARVGQSNSIVLGNGSANVGVGTSTPAASAALDLTSTTKGILIPRMTTTQRNAISSPATGLQVYDLTLNTLYFYNGTAWTAATSAASPFGKSGSKITLNTTTDSVGLGKTPGYKLDVQGIINTDSSYWISGKKVFACDLSLYNILIGEAAGRYMISGHGNYFCGLSAGYANTYGSNNNFIGLFSGFANTYGNNNNFTGFNAGYSNTTGNENSFTGIESGYSNTTGSANIFTGSQAGYSNTTGSANIFTGLYAGSSNTTGYENIFTGSQAGSSNTTGYDNIFTGVNAGYSNTTGSGNNFTGFFAGYSNTTGYENIFTGNQAGYSNTSGQLNIFLGTAAGYKNTTGSKNISIGYEAGGKCTTAVENVVIGYDAGHYLVNDYCTVIGAHADAGNNKGSAFGMGASAVGLNSTALGYNATASANNSFQFGDANISTINFGAGSCSSAEQMKLPSGAGCGTNGVWFNKSDSTAKNNILKLDTRDVLNKITELHLSRWSYKGDSGKISHIGPMAQDFYDKFGTGHNNITVSTIDPAGVALVGIQELAKQNKVLITNNDSLKNEVAVLKSVVIDIKTKNEELAAQAAQQQAVNASLQSLIAQVRDAQIACCRVQGNLEAAATLDVAVLEQNNPNPFTEVTTIRYYLPANSVPASINITSAEGKVIQSFKLTTAGNGQVIIPASLLAAGTYYYNLVINGVHADSKKMTLVK